MTRLLILPSPFLGPDAYRPWAAALRDLGVDATVATYDDPPVATDVIARWAEQAAGYDDVVLVPHSNAGLLAPAVSGLLGGLPTVFVDAALPGPGATTPLAPPRFREHLSGLADGAGLLPRWTRWWPRAELAGTLPGPWFEQLDGSLPRVPLSYVLGEAPVPADWSGGGCGYVAFGAETYAAELGRARALGWPVHVVEGAGHLHCLLAPGASASAVVGVWEEVRARSSGADPGQPLGRGR